MNKKRFSENSERFETLQNEIIEKYQGIEDKSKEEKYNTYLKILKLSKQQIDICSEQLHTCNEKQDTKTGEKYKKAISHIDTRIQLLKVDLFFMKSK